MPQVAVLSKRGRFTVADPVFERGGRVTLDGGRRELFLIIADRHARGRLVSVLEGGYDLTALAESVATHVRTLMRG